MFEHKLKIKIFMEKKSTVYFYSLYNFASYFIISAPNLPFALMAFFNAIFKHRSRKRANICRCRVKCKVKT